MHYRNLELNVVFLLLNISMSLLADQKALQAQLIEQLAEIRLQELNNLVSRGSYVGLTASIVGGFAVQILLAGVNIESTHIWILTLFYVTSFGCLLSATHLVVITSFISSRAPLAALRGRHGAVPHALKAVQNEQYHVDFWLVASLVFFVLQTLSFLWLSSLADATNTKLLDAVIVSVIILCALHFSRRHTVQMVKGFSVADQHTKLQLQECAEP